MPVTVEERVGVLEAGQIDIRGDVKSIQHDIREIHNTLAGRPSWAVATIIAVLSSTCCGLIVALATSVNF